MKNSALVVIDLQNDITKHYREIIDPVNAAIDWAVQKELWVIYIQHNNLSAGTRTFKPGTRGAELVSELNVVSGHIFTKSARRSPLLFRSMGFPSFTLSEQTRLLHLAALILLTVGYTLILTRTLPQNTEQV